MSSYKREFQMVWSSGHPVTDVKASIIGQLPETGKPYVSINAYQGSNPIFIADKDFERFAVNILRALKSKRLKAGNKKLTTKKIKNNERRSKENFSTSRCRR